VDGFHETDGPEEDARAKAEKGPIRVFRRGETWLVDYGSYTHGYYGTRAEAVDEGKAAASREGRELEIDDLRQAPRATVRNFGMTGDDMNTLADDGRHLRVLIANERPERLGILAEVVTRLGHLVVVREVDIKGIAAVTARERPDVALVALGVSSGHALDLISEIVREASCPVITLLRANDPAYIHEAAKRGVFAYIVDGTPEELQSAIDITLQRFSEYHNLQGAFARRATIEQAKGILMATHGLSGDQAFAKLRSHSHQTGRKLADIATAIVDSHLLLLPPVRPDAGPAEPEPAPAPVPKST
jgi:two-component system, response regulator / RNA-binding antiterminator